MAKTVQALKIAASWTPHQPVAGSMMNEALKGSAAFGIRFSGGRLALKHAIRIDFSDPAQAQRVSQRVAEIKEALEATGTVHEFRTTAGAVHADEAEELREPAVADEPEPEPATATEAEPAPEPKPARKRTAAAA